jgi:hypothetical protein
MLSAGRRTLHATGPCARILTTRLMAAFLANEPNELFLGQLKQHLRIEPLPDYGDVSISWAAASLLRTVTARLDAPAASFLRSLVAVLNGEQTVQSLYHWPFWADAMINPLDSPWPERIKMMPDASGVQ